MRFWWCDFGGMRLCWSAFGDAPLRNASLMRCLFDDVTLTERLRGMVTAAY